MATRINNIMIVMVFLLAITLPLAFSDKVGGKISVTENRYLATFPAILTKDMNFAPGFTKGLDNWIQDNAGGRDLALQIYETISYKVFHIIPEQDVVGGKDNWLYIIYHSRLPECVHTNLPTQAQLDWLKSNFSKISTDLKSENAEYLVMLLPYQCNVYPENLPESLVQVKQELQRWTC